MSHSDPSDLQIFCTHLASGARKLSGPRKIRTAYSKILSNEARGAVSRDNSELRARVNLNAIQQI